MKLSSEIENFKRAAHEGPPLFFVGNSEGQDWKFQARLNISSEIYFINLWALRVVNPRQTTFNVSRLAVRARNCALWNRYRFESRNSAHRSHAPFMWVRFWTLRSSVEETIKEKKCTQSIRLEIAPPCPTYQLWTALIRQGKSSQNARSGSPDWLGVPIMGPFFVQRLLRFRACFPWNSGVQRDIWLSST